MCSEGRCLTICVPLFLLGIIGYSTWVFVDLITLRYLLHPSPSLREAELPPRPAAAIGLITVFFVLLLLMLAAQLRCMVSMCMGVGVVPRSDARSALVEKPPPAQFDRLDAFVCDPRGEPQWCEKCRAYKPDRAHHCSHTGRCVLKMDHFCPWAGGVVGEGNYNFFLQLLFYASLYTSLLLVVAAVYGSEYARHLPEQGFPGTWIALIALAGFFFVFVSVLFCSSMYSVSLNRTAVEEAQRNDTAFIAILNRRHSGSGAAANSHPQSTIAGQSANSSRPQTQSVRRTGSREYVIVRLKTGDNPWDLGRLANLQSVLGYTMWEWLLPIYHSPCTFHGSISGLYEWGPLLDQLKRENAIGSDRPHT